ncbi:MAG: DUF1016 N-terminal domain-containing protein [Clostridiales bacterium]|jgi:predicted nuclease of restriction endonuclease-like (RecB) superfamily|nr:DUF1016 N-terminal domain-containing protein [Clostridiales bacterium]
MENGVTLYGPFIKEIKDLIYRRQYEAMKRVNAELMQLYWEIGAQIDRKQRTEGWGKSVVEVLARELQKEFPGIKGFSARNLWLMRNFYIEFSQKLILQPLVAEIEDVNLKPLVPEIENENQKPKVADLNSAILPPLVAEISWSKNIIIMQKCKDRTRVEYTLKTANKPIGVATYSYYESLPKNMRDMLPSPEEIADIISGIDGGLAALGGIAEFDEAGVGDE